MPLAVLKLSIYIRREKTDGRPEFYETDIGFLSRRNVYPFPSPPGPLIRSFTTFSIIYLLFRIINAGTDQIYFIHLLIIFRAQNNRWTIITPK